MTNIIHAETLFLAKEYLQFMYPDDYVQYMKDHEITDYEIALFSVERFRGQVKEQNRIISQRSCKVT